MTTRKFVFSGSPVTLSLVRVLTVAAAMIGTVSYSHAAPIYFNPNTDFSASPTTISFGGGLASYTFSYLGGPSNNVDAVATGGNALLNYFTFFGMDQIVSFQVDSPIGQTGYPFKAFPTPTQIDFSIANVFLGLSFDLVDGQHFGFAQVAGPTLVRYGYESEVGTPIVANLITAAEIPEPVTLSLFSVGLVGGFALRRRKKDIQIRST